MSVAEGPRATAKVRQVVLDVVGRRDTEKESRDPGVEANARLTATAGLLLLVMLAAEGLTLVSIRGLLSWHVAIGLALIPPISLKLGSTLWRFSRYYLGDVRYTESGPPHPILRILGPLVIISTVAVMATGVTLWLEGPSSSFGFLHRATFIVWVALMTIHVLAHVLRAVRLARADVDRHPRAHRHGRRARHAPPPLPGPHVRQGAVLASMAAGVVLALLAKGAAGGLGQWMHYHP